MVVVWNACVVLGGSMVVCWAVVVVAGSVVDDGVAIVESGRVVISEAGGDSVVDNGPVPAVAAVVFVTTFDTCVVVVGVLATVVGAAVVVVGTDVVVVSVIVTRTILAPAPPFCPMYKYPLRSAVRERGFLRRPAAP